MEETDSTSASQESLESCLERVKREPGNAKARVRLALAYRMEARHDQELAELATASEIFFEQSELKDCIAACEQALELDPNNKVVRERQRKAVLKRDAFTALESAIQRSRPDDEGETKSGQGDKAGRGCLVLIVFIMAGVTGIVGLIHFLA